MTAAQLSVTFFLQLFVILLVCRVVGLLAKRLGQPQVIGEMVAGVLLGPSLFGYFAPGWQQQLFAPDSLNTLYVVAQLGITLYMFVVGMQFKTELFRKHIRSAASVSLAGIVVPFVLGAVLMPWLLKMPGLFSEEVRPLEAWLFLGAAIGITAFPMLARIIHERGLTGSALGTLALSAGAIDDAAAWCVLALVLATFGGGANAALFAIAGGVLYALLITTIGRRLLAFLGGRAEREQRVGIPLLGVVLMLLMFAAWAMDAIGIHAVFGGFLLGTAMPRGLLAQELQRQLEPFAVAFLLPIFFTFSGLSTHLDLVMSPHLLGVALAVLAASIAGKGLACWAAARLSGQDNRTALAIGTLMNARGLMELVIINIGLHRGVIGAPLFSILVLMTMVTTLMASPLFELFYGRHARRTGQLGGTTVA